MNASVLTVYRQEILKFLDDLQCPLLLLPRLKYTDTIQRIGFFTDLRFTDIPMLAVLAKTAKSLQAEVVIFNISEPDISEMDYAYAGKYFSEKVLPEMKGLTLSFVNMQKIAHI